MATIQSVKDSFIGSLRLVAGLYQSSRELLTDGDAGAVAVNARRVLLGAADFSILTLTAATPAPTGSDITNAAGGAIVAGDLQIRDAYPVVHSFIIPVATAGFRKLVLRLKITAFDQNVGAQMYLSNSLGTLISNGTITAGWTAISFSDGATGTGGAGGFANYGHVAVPVMGSGIDAVYFQLSAGTAPTVGAAELTIIRST